MTSSRFDYFGARMVTIVTGRKNFSRVYWNEPAPPWYVLSGVRAVYIHPGKPYGTITAFKKQDNKLSNHE